MANKDQIDGAARQVKGSIKEALGKATGSVRTEASGTADLAAGKLQSKLGDMKAKASNPPNK